MTLKWENLYVSVVNKNATLKTKYVDLIKGTTGCVNPGEILAIMGPSGGGKSTLLNALAGRIPDGSLTQGTILYNDQPRSKDTWFNTIGFVEQETVLIDELSVSETLFYHHIFSGEKRKNSPNEVQGNRKEIVKNVIADMNLQKSEKNLIKKLSGGERKRTAIGTILVSEPSILFLDEPTSGLDTLTALKIMKILKKLAVEKQKTIIITIHQPSMEVFLMMNQLILLSEGNVMFQGSVNETDKYFTDLGFTKRPNVSVPEHIMEICSSDFRHENPDLYNIENGIFRDKCVVIDKIKLKSTNDTQLSLKISLPVIIGLLKRRLNILKRKKIEFAKNFFGNIFAQYLFFMSILLIINAWDFIILIYQNGANRKNQENSFIQNSLCHFVSMSVFLPIQFSMVKFYEELELIKKEIVNLVYTPASFYIFMMIYLLFQELITGAISFLLFFAIFRMINIYVICTFFITPLISLPFGLLVASFTPTKTLVPLFSTFFGFLASITPIKIIRIKTYLLSKFGSSIPFIPKFMCVFAFITPLYYTSLLSHKMSNYQLPASNQNNDILTYLGVIVLNTTVLYVLVPVATILCILTGIYILGYKTRTGIRLQTQRNA